MDKVKCLICGEEASERGLSKHLSSKHGMSLAEYMCRYHPKVCPVTQTKIPFKNRRQYEEQNFSSQRAFAVWADKAKPSEYVKKWCLSKLEARIQEKELKHIPSHVELHTLVEHPDWIHLLRIFGSEASVLKNLGLNPIFSVGAPPQMTETQAARLGGTILVDTREQQPLSFPNSKSEKLMFGDYSLSGEHYSYAYVDRKSEGDFKSTVTVGFDRFCREVERTIEFGCVIFVVVESSVAEIEKNNLRSAHRAKMPWVWSRMREIQHMYPRKVQFVFSGSRLGSQKVIPYILAYGSDLINYDIQYLLDSKNK